MKYDELYLKWKIGMQEEFKRTRDVFEKEGEFKHGDYSELHTDTYKIRTEEIGELCSDLSNFMEVSEIIIGNIPKTGVDERFINYSLDTDVDCWSSGDECHVEDVVITYNTNQFVLIDKLNYFNSPHLYRRSLTSFIASEVTKLNATTIYATAISCPILKMYKDGKITLADIKDLITC